MTHTAVPARWSRSLPPVYAAAVLRLALPLLVLPTVAARVGAHEFGRLGLILVWSGLLSLIVEGGFLASATRLTVTTDAAGRWRLAQQVFSARCVLCLPAVLLSFVVVRWVSGEPVMQPWIDGLSVAALACVLGAPATWYLQATQQLDRWARVELVVYGAMIAVCWLFVHSVEAYVAAQFAVAAVLAVLGWRWLHRDLHPLQCGAAARLWQRPEVAPGLRLGWTMMPVSIAGAAYTFALPAAASVQMAKTELGLYFMADRIVRAVLGGADPLFSLVYPRMVALFGRGQGAALRYAGRWALGGAWAGAGLLFGGWLAWPWLAPLVAPGEGGLDREQLYAVLQVLGWLLPLLLSWKFIGYWMLGSGRYDTAYRSAVVVGGVVGVLAAATVGGAAGATGLAWTSLAVEWVVIAVAVGGMLLTRMLRG